MQMSLNRKSFQQVFTAVLAVLVLAVAVQAQQTANEVKIKNFGQMDDRFFRGAQPKTEADYKALAAMGINTVIDLTDDPKEYEKPMVEALGMKYVHIPMIAKKYPTEAAIKSFLETVENPDTGKFYLHCAGGRHRTGALGAVYRYKFYDWNYDQVYKEMKQFDFYTSWGHGAFKDFVKDYYEQILATKIVAPVVADAEKTSDKAMDKK
ncbi:MAG TPA: tyrosine-protein phosphatase [Pyrinomonadaceae bacterium]